MISGAGVWAAGFTVTIKKPMTMTARRSSKTAKLERIVCVLTLKPSSEFMTIYGSRPAL
jgi:hypothetical protein